MSGDKRQFKEAFFEGICYLRCWKPESQLMIVLYFLLELLCELPLINLKQLNETNAENENFLFTATETLGNYLYFTRLELFSNFVDQIYISLGINILMMIGYVLLIVLLFKNTEKDWQGYLIYALHFLSRIFFLPFFAFQTNFIKMSIIQTHYYFVVAGVLSGVINILVNYISEQLSFTISLKKKRKMDRYYCFFNSKKIIIYAAIVTYVSIKGELARTQTTFLVIILLLVNIFNLVIKFQSVIYLDEIVSQISTIGNSFFICFYFLALLQINISLLRESLTVTVLISTIGFVWSRKTVIQSYQYNLELKDFKEIQSASEADTFIKVFYNTSINYKENFEGMILAGKIYKHFQECENVECFCKDKLQTEKPPHRNKFFLKPFSVYTIKKIYQKFQLSLNVTLTYLSYKIEIAEQYPLMFQKLRKIAKQNKYRLCSLFYLHQDFIYFQLRKMIESILQRQMKNKTTSLSLTCVFEQQKLEERVKGSIKKTLDLLSSIYRSLNRAICNFNSLNQSFVSLYETFIFINEKWLETKKKSKSIETYHLFYFYFQKILDLSFEQKELIYEVRRISKKLVSNQKHKFQLDYLLFSEQGGVVQSVVHSSKIGIINRVSKNMENILGADNSKIINTRIQNFFLPSLRQQHKKLLIKWCQNSTYGIFNRLLDVYMVTFKDNVFHAKFILQMFLKNNQLFFSFSIIKINGNDYLVLNKDGIIQGFGELYLSIFPAQFKGRSFSLICSKWKEIIKTAKHEKQKAKITLTSYRISNKTVDITEFDNLNFQNSMDELGQYHLDIQYFTWTLRNKSVIVIKSNQVEKKMVQDTKTKMYQFFLDAFTPQKPQRRRSIFKKTSDNSEDKSHNNADHHLVETHSRSSMIDDNLYSIEKIMISLFENAVKGEKLERESTKSTKNFLILTALFLLILIGGQLFFYSRGLLSFGQIVQANGIVNNNMQLTQLIFNKISKLSSYCTGNQEDFERCQYIKDSTIKLEDLLHQKYTQHFRNFLKSQTFFSHRYFEYQMDQSALFLNGLKQPVSTVQFVQYFSYASGKIVEIIEKQKYFNSKAEYVYQQIIKNWQSLKQTDHRNLQYYQKIGIQELQSIQKIIMAFLILHLLFLSVFIVLVYRHSKKNEDKQKQILFIFRLIPLSLIEDLKSYYTDLSYNIWKKSVLDLIDVPYPTTKVTNSSKSVDFTFSFSYAIKIILLAAWVIVTILNVEIFFTMNDLSPKCSKILETMTHMMNSETYMMESYFDLRAHYMKGSEFSEKQFQMKIIKNLSQNQILFNKYALNFLSFFEEDNPSFFKEMSELLINDVCQLIEDEIDQEQSKKCQNQMQFKILEEGILPTVSFFQRTVFQAFFQLKNQNTEPNAFFKQQIMQDLDDYVFYMIKLYKKIQKTMQKGLHETLISRIISSSLLDTLEVAMLMIILTVWVRMLRYENLKIAQLNGYVIFFPKIVIKENKMVLKSITKNLIKQ